MKWRHLRVANEKLPPLLIDANFSYLGYCIRLTDLARIWDETLISENIIAQARKRNCSIDPGEDNSQYQLLLDKLQSALKQDDNTNLSISVTNAGKLKLHLEAQLPSPLPPLEWEVSLERAHDSAVGDQLISPLLLQVHNFNHRMESLIAEIQAKDRIIAKITDRLETSGHDLTAVFPGVSNIKLTRKASQQEQLARHIRGLGKFDEESWKAQLRPPIDVADLNTSSEDAIFASLPYSNIEIGCTEEAVDWWRHIPAGRHIDLDEEDPRNASSGAVGALHKAPSPLKRGTSDAHVSQYDGFQRQATPPRLRSHPLPTAKQDDVEMSGVGKPASPDEDSTEDEDDLDRPSQKPSTSHGHTTREAINAQDEQAPPESPPPSPPPASNFTAQPSTARGPFIHEEDTEDDDEDDLDGPSQPSQKAKSTSQLASRQKSQTPQPPVSTRCSPKRTLGKLGGRLPSKPLSKSPTPPAGEELSDPTPITNPSLPDPQPKAKARLGTIGGRKAKIQPLPLPSSPPPPDTSTTRSAPAVARRSTTSPEPQQRLKSSREQPSAETTVEPKTVQQTEAERADAKREALKRELEAKAKAPVKKKRKF